MSGNNPRNEDGYTLVTQRFTGTGNKLGRIIDGRFACHHRDMGSVESSMDIPHHTRYIDWYHDLDMTKDQAHYQNDCTARPKQIRQSIKRYT